MKKASQNPNDIVSKIKTGDRFALAKALTIIESNSEKDRELAEEIIELCWNVDHASWRIGITGPPGVGKSTFIDRFGSYALSKGHRIAVLTVDPTSHISHGSILGDKTRMESLSKETDVFIRPSPNQTVLGGLQRRTADSIILCESAGYDIIIIETVGVGQSEIDVRHLVDCLTLMLLPNSGDELQGIKRGIMESADLIIVHKAEESNENEVRLAIDQLQTAIHLSPAKINDWRTIISGVSSLENKGISSFYDGVEKYFRLIKNNNYYHLNRKNQLYSHVKKHLIALQMSHYQKINKDYTEYIEAELKEAKKSPLKIAADLFKLQLRK